MDIHWKRKRVDLIARRVKAARECGRRFARLDPHWAERIVELRVMTPHQLTGVERDALVNLLPVTWWANFNMGVRDVIEEAS